MKKILIALAFAILTVSLSAKEISKNSDTGMKLTEELGVYSISGPGGILILGDIKTTRNTLASLEKCFIQEHIKDYISCGDQKYEVKSDDKGLYIIKAGAGAVKIRHSDVSIFLLKVEAIITKDKISRISKIITE